MREKALIRTRIALGMTVLALAGACLRPDFSAAERPNFVFVLIDTLRQDHLGCYGYGRATSPFIDGLAGTGTIFENAVTQAPWTAPSMASLWTSRYPSEVGVGAVPRVSGIRNLDDRSATELVDSVPTLAEILSGGGYATMAATANVWASDFVAMLRGFELKNETVGQADRVFDGILELIDLHLGSKRSPAPFFAYVHLTDVHTPTEPPPPFDTIFRTIDGKPHTARHEKWSFASARELDSEAFRVFKSHKLALYDGAIAFVDAQIRRLAEHLERLGAAEKTIWIIASDHGEEFWDSPEFDPKFEHNPQAKGAVGHGHSLLREVLDVPLVFSGPGVPRARETRLVRNLDIAPTVLALAGLPSPTGALGVDLFGGSDGSDLPAFSEDLAYGYEAKALQIGGIKYLRYTDHPGSPAFLFDLARDPEEIHNLIDTEPDLADDLGRRLAGILADIERPKSSLAVASEEDVQRLMGLGYIGQSPDR